MQLCGSIRQLIFSSASQSAAGILISSHRGSQPVRQYPQLFCTSIISQKVLLWYGTSLHVVTEWVVTRYGQLLDNVKNFSQLGEKDLELN